MAYFLLVVWVKRRPVMKKLVKALFILLVLLRVGQGFSKPPIPDSVELPEDKERNASTI
tara:strand:+ start:1202 stop:1378 length:177 start_codon:yes stop_codon:yes gene_type:complete